MPFTSSFPDVELPTTDLWGFMLERTPAAQLSDRPMYIDVDTKEEYSFKQVKDQSIRFGNYLLHSLKWKKGDVLCIFSPNSIDYSSILWGCHWAGGIVTPANPAFTVDELAYQLKDANATAIATQVPLLQTVLQAAKKVGVLEERIVLFGDERDPKGKIVHFRNLPISEVLQTRPFNVSATDLAFLPYSSGTTGRPKGVMLSHLNITSNIKMIDPFYDRYLKPEKDRLLAFLPFFHIYGLTVIMHYYFHAGVTAVVMPRFDVEKFCRSVVDYQITITHAVPPVALALAASPIVSKYDLSSLKHILSAAAPLPTDLITKVYQRTKIRIVQAYGLTETSPGATFQPRETWKSKIGTVGVLLPSQVAKVVSSEGKELAANETGEIWLKGPNIFSEYLNQDDESKKSFSSDGYFITGDVGHVDDEGYFYITDRAKELIKYKGFQVAPAELEALLVSHEKVDDAAVIGVRDKKSGDELPRAFVKVKPGVEADNKTAEEIQSWLSGRVAYYKRLRGGIGFVDEIPKSASGKTLRRLLRGKDVNDQAGAVPKL